MIAAKSSTLSDAPPMRPPSMSGWARSAVFCVHGAAVEDAHLAGDERAVLRAQILADVEADLLRLLVGRGAARADGPDGLVGDDDLLYLLGGQAVQRRLDLIGDALHREIAVALGERLADAHDRGDALFEQRVDLRVHELVGVAVIRAALAVADDAVFRAEIGDHVHADLAGVRALIELGDVLRADADAPRLFARERGEMCRRDAENDAAPVHARGQLRFQLLDERLYARGKLVHFPVSGDDDFSVFLVHSGFLPSVNTRKGAEPAPLVKNYLSSRQATPGSSLPSMNSSDAPPPVETWVTLSA